MAEQKGTYLEEYLESVVLLPSEIKRVRPTTTHATHHVASLFSTRLYRELRVRAEDREQWHWGRNTTACAFVAVAFASPRRDTHAQHCTNMLSRRVAIGIRARRLVLHASRSTLHAHVALALPALPSPCHARSSRSPLSLPVLSHPPTQLSLSHSSSLTPTVSPAHTLPSEL